ncbi:hypothetical protein BJ878DRAFT_491420 [Calycina marina]|uniref:GST N-terminal domain-containing protein n=1 Tax=Calycina marina TaxID=1763456 RepID=A0A9P8CHV6_9HELO|nr:hypothetical protein BJ878DRAFT_491420 [Calycina marina]
MFAITFLDIPSKKNAGWSYNTWRTRLVLNYKKVDYKTEWVEYPDIASRLQDHVVPNHPGTTAYTLPALQGDRFHIMGSAAIASFLEGKFPEPSLHLSPHIQEVETAVARIMQPTRGAWLLLVSNNLLNPKSKEYFDSTRGDSLGKTLEALHAEDGGEEAWIESLPKFKALGELLGKEGGPFVMGSTISYADFIILGWLQFFKTIDEALLKKVVDIEPALGKIYDAGNPWLERVD